MPIRPDDAAQRKDGIGRGVVQRHVDAFGNAGIAASEINLDSVTEFHNTQIFQFA